MMHRALVATLLILLVTPLPALCQACASGTCPDRVANEEHDHAAMDHPAMDHPAMDHPAMDHPAEAPSCHQAAATSNSEQAAPNAALSAQASGPGCCSTMEAPAPVLAAPAQSLHANGALATLERTGAASMDRIVSVSEAPPRAPPPLALPPLYTLLSSLLI